MLRRFVIAAALVTIAGTTYAVGRWLSATDGSADQSDEDAWLRGDAIPRPARLPGDAWFRASGRESPGPRAIP